MEPNFGPVAKPVPIVVLVHSEHPSKATPSVLDLLFNAAQKAPHPGVIIVKQEASWFQLQEEKR